MHPLLSCSSATAGAAEGLDSNAARRPALTPFAIPEPAWHRHSRAARQRARIAVRLGPALPDPVRLNPGTLDSFFIMFIACYSFLHVFGVALFSLLYLFISLYSFFISSYSLCIALYILLYLCYSCFIVLCIFIQVFMHMFLSRLYVFSYIL